MGLRGPSVRPSFVLLGLGARTSGNRTVTASVSEYLPGTGPHLDRWDLEVSMRDHSPNVWSAFYLAREWAGDLSVLRGVSVSNVTKETILFLRGS